MLEAARQDKVKSIAAVGALHALLAYAFLAGLDAHFDPAPERPLKTFDISIPAPPPPVEDIAPDRQAAPEPEGRAASPALKAEASPVVAPTPKVVVPSPLPVTAAPEPGRGVDTSQGASTIPGPGTGAGGVGSGTGSGGQGSGTGGGGAATKARQISGRIVNADYPRAARRAGAAGEVLVRFTVEANGRVGACSVARSSGNADLDGTTCRLIQQRYRFEPARNAQGRAIREEKAWMQRWWLERD